MLAVALTAANYTLFSKTPAQVQQVEHDLMEEARYAEQMLEQELKGWWSMASSTANKEPLLSSSGEQLPPPPPQGNSQWVEGEQRLKRELQKLVALQEQGKELGVPVLTRWLGEDIPAWAGEGVDRNEWDAKVQARYAEMRQDEERWRERIAAAIQAEQRG